MLKTQTENNKLRNLDWITSPTARAIGALLIVFVIGLIFNADGAFFKWGTHRDMMRSVSVFGILSCGMTLVIISGGIDLSVGSVLALTAVTFSLTTVHLGWSIPLSIAATLGAGLACGAASGFIIGKFRIQPFIATLAMMVFARGAAKWISGGEKISTAVQQEDGSYIYVEIPDIFNFINSKLLSDNIAVVTVILLICVIICWVLLTKLRHGRYIYAIGGNEQAAYFSGVPVFLVKIITYSVAGVFSAVAGICQASQELQGDPQAGVTYELTAIAMVVIGGTTLKGGRGSIWLTLLGILTIGYLEKILSINAVGEDKRLMLTGTIIVAAVLLQKGQD